MHKQTQTQTQTHRHRHTDTHTHTHIQGKAYTHARTHARTHTHTKKKNLYACCVQQKHPQGNSLGIWSLLGRFIEHGSVEGKNANKVANLIRVQRIDLAIMQCEE